MTQQPVYLVDTNVILRFLLNDHPQYSKAARNLFKQAQSGGVVLEVPFMAISETVFTLTSLLKLPRDEVSRVILNLFAAPGIKIKGPIWVIDALDEFATSKASFGDVCIAAEARASDMVVASFDRDFDTFVGVVRYEPS